ncbi:cell division cycle 40 homolog (yeast) (predicted), isoform CRA_b [Rattus norvegicus]|uniref:Cell division cycle 40 homolog (Yeast) (Predicted), isoform CRA_b n=1 Tax=Rattus norvegicus TaxID=10116 RepID=A6KTC5_RAT|nr:cell division cycle 40 homolog (yeast) (predicted), isoform CRA_b [Rattus norvegicus]
MHLILMVSWDRGQNTWMKKMWPSLQKKNKRSWMKSQQRGRRKANRRKRSLGRRRPSYMLKKCMTIKAGPTSTSLRMLVLTCAHLCHLRNVTFPKNKSTCGPDTQRASVLSGCFLFPDICCCLAPWTVKLR